MLYNNKGKKANDKYLSFPFCLSKTKALFSDESYLITPGNPATVFTPVLRVAANLSLTTLTDVALDNTAQEDIHWHCTFFFFLLELVANI